MRFKFPQQIAERLFPLTISVVDIGGQNLVSEDHVYAPLVKLGVARVTAFEPLKAEANLRRQTESQTKMLEYFIGLGGPGRFYVTSFNPASSLFAPNLSFLCQFNSLATMCSPISSEDVTTTRLDDVSEIDKCDFLKIDVQGGELDVLLGAKRILSDAIVVHTEVEFAPVYENQPLFADIDQTLREQDFELIDLQNRGYNSYSALKYPLSKSRLLWADAVYFKTPEYFAKQDPDKLLLSAFIAHNNYGMYDLAAHCLAIYDAVRGTDTATEYNQSVLSMASSGAVRHEDRK